MNELDLVQLADNPDPRAPCLLLLDTSASMSGAPIQALNDGLRAFKDDLMNDELARRRVEVAVVAFGNGGARTIQDFTTAEDWNPEPLTAGGATPMGEAMTRGMELLRSRKDLYKRAGLQYFRPWMFLITDGEPTDRWQDAAQEAKREDAQKGLVFFTVGVDRANMQRLAGIAPQDRPPLRLKGLMFAELFLWLSQSQQKVSHSRMGEQMELPPVGWADVSV